MLSRVVVLFPVLVACGSVNGSSTDAPSAGDAATGDGGQGPQIVTSNSVSRADVPTGVQPLMVPAGKTYVIDTDNGSMFDVTGGGNAPVRIAGDGVQNGVFYRTDNLNRGFLGMQSLTIGEGAILRGVGGRSLILVADGAIEIHGIVDVSAGHCSPTSDGQQCGGPGGGAGGVGSTGNLGNGGAGCGAGQGGHSETGAGGGGGGGAFGSSGAGGGFGNGPGTGVTGGNGGTSASCPGVTLDPILGGSGGGFGGGSAVIKPGGGGGGAVQITSFTSIAGFMPSTPNTSGVWSGGQGGGVGMPGGSGVGGGSGGGAGGAIILEAPTITLAAGVILAANGGGGGAGQVNNGQPGQFSSTPATGGSASGGAGGAGAALGTDAIVGSAGVAVTNSTVGIGGGGGGGGAGRIRINAVTLTSVSSVVMSPTPSINVPAATN